MISQSLMAHSRLCESATGKVREMGDILVYHKGLNRKIWMTVRTKDAGSAKATHWGMPHNDDGENLPNKEIQLVADRSRGYVTK